MNATGTLPNVVFHTDNRTKQARTWMVEVDSRA